jgi:hypothetical protein
MAHDKPKMRGTLRPMLRASSWSSEVARIDSPILVRLKKKPKATAASMAKTKVVTRVFFKIMASLNAPGNGILKTSLGGKGVGK